MRLRTAITLLLAVTCQAGRWDLIPSDAAKVSPAGKQLFLNAICPGHATGKGCSVCPEETPFSRQTWDLRSITFGHFRGPRSNDALISGFGCEPHSSMMSGAFLFTRERAAWRKVWYTPAQNAADCKKVAASDGRDLLVCAAADTHEGVSDSFLYLIDAGKHPGEPDNNSIEIFFGLDDSRETCVKLADGTVAKGEIESVSFVPNPTPPNVTISVVARLGKAAIPDKLLENCQAGPKGLP